MIECLEIPIQKEDLKRMRSDCGRGGSAPEIVRQTLKATRIGALGLIAVAALHAHAGGDDTQDYWQQVETETEAYIEELLDLLGLQDRRNHLPSELSGGQQQRVSIARALAYKPSIILADEPTGNLDSKNSREILDLLKISVKRYNQTLMVITHDIDIASQADRIITIEDGIISKDEVIAI